MKHLSRLATGLALLLCCLVSVGAQAQMAIGSGDNFCVVLGEGGRVKTFCNGRNVSMGGATGDASQQFTFATSALVAAGFKVQMDCRVHTDGPLSHSCILVRDK